MPIRLPPKALTAIWWRSPVEARASCKVLFSLRRGRVDSNKRSTSVAFLHHGQTCWGLTG